jgi:hypothetical protein
MPNFYPTGGPSQPVHHLAGAEADALDLALEKDHESGALVMIDYEHSRVHEHQMFSLSLVNEALVDDAAINFVITTGATKELHLIPAFSVGGDARVIVSEAPTTSGGSAATPRNMYRPATETAEFTVVSGATISNVGTLLWDAIIPGGTGPGSAGAHVRPGTEWVLKKSTKYLIRLTNIANTTQPASLNMEGYEVED